MTILLLPKISTVTVDINGVFVLFYCCGGQIVLISNNSNSALPNNIHYLNYLKSKQFALHCKKTKQIRHWYPWWLYWSWAVTNLSFVDVWCHRGTIIFNKMSMLKVRKVKDRKNSRELLNCILKFFKLQKRIYFKKKYF